MIAPVFAVCAASDAVRGLLGDSPLRLYPFGLHDDNVIYPYAVWQNIGGEPGNYLAQSPDVDRYTVQMDVYARTSDEAIAVAAALRAAVEGYAYVTRLGQQMRDPETLCYRYSFDADWIVNR